jgi:hypothetical protein
MSQLCKLHPCLACGGVAYNTIKVVCVVVGSVEHVTHTYQCNSCGVCKSIPMVAGRPVETVASSMLAQRRLIPAQFV